MRQIFLQDSLEAGDGSSAWACAYMACSTDPAYWAAQTVTTDTGTTDTVSCLAVTISSIDSSLYPLLGVSVTLMAVNYVNHFYPPNLTEG